MDYRLEKDTLGEVEVPNSRYYGSQTARSLENFDIGQEKMPYEVIMALGVVKKAAAQINAELGILPKEKADLISQVTDEIIDGQLDEHFPLVVWQTGSGTQKQYEC